MTVMSRNHLSMALLLALTASLSLPVAGQPMLEIVPLRHRTAEQVLPALRLLLEPGATLSGRGNQLFLRASPANRAELKQVLAAIDRPLRRLQLSVRFESLGEAATSSVEAGARLGGRHSRIDVRAHEAQAEAHGRVDQRLQVLEGARARIAAGRSAPIGDAVHEIGTGFHVIPRISGDTVFLEIATEQAGRESQRIATTVSGRLGEWLEMGGAAGATTRSDRGLLSTRQQHFAEARRVWVKVEELH